MFLEFDNGIDPRYDALEERYARLMEAAYARLDVPRNFEVDVSLVGDEEIHRINAEYRNVDRVTDVISFAFDDARDEKSKIVNDPEIPHLLGEIFICVPQALRQAETIGNSAERELDFLFVHGLLHLLGYDHMKKEDELAMFPLQEEILALAAQERKDL